MQKYKLSWRDISFNDFKVYLFALFKAFIPKKKIKNLDELEHFIQTKSAWVTQVTLYSYLKTRMGTRYVLHFDNDIFMSSLNIAKWNIYSVALQDLTFFTFSYLKVNFNFKNINWESYHGDLPFNPSALSLYRWAPIAEELKSLDRKIVLNSMILKWDIIRKEFEKLIEF